MFNLNNLDFSRSYRVFIFGNPGSGKTKLLTYLTIKYLMSSCEFIDYFIDEVKELNNYGFNFNCHFEHLGFSNFSVNTDGTEIPDMQTYKVNPYKIGLVGNSKFNTDVFPFGTNFFITEAQNYWPSGMNEYIRPEVIQYFQTSRHADISFFIDAQRPFDVAKKIRDLFDIFIECISCEDIYENNCYVGTHWNLRMIEGPKVLEEYLRTNNENLYISFEIDCPYLLNYNYDSKMCRMLHLNGRERQDFKFEYFGDKVEDILTAPDGYFIKRSERVVNSENNDNTEVIF